MRTTVIALEQRDSLISACDKMDWCKTGRIVLVWPKKGALFFRKLDLICLLRHSQRLGAQLALVCVDDAQATLALEMGIPVFDTAEQAQYRAWKRPYIKHGIKIPENRRSFGSAKPEHESILNNNWNKSWIRVGAFLSGLFAVVALFMIFLPYGRVSIEINPERQKLEIPLWVNSNVTGSNLSGGIPAVRKVVILMAKNQSGVSGRKSLDFVHARGTVVFTNLTGTVVQIPKGIVVATSNSTSVRFITESEITLSLAGEKSVPVAVRAAVSGSGGNVPAGAIQAIEGLLGSKLAVTNPNPTTGGADEWVAVPSESDYLALRLAVLEELSKLARKEFAAGLDPGQILIEDSQKMERIIEEIREPLAGVPSDTAQLIIRAEFSALTIRTADIDRVVNSSLDANLRAGNQALLGSTQWELLGKPSISGDRLEWIVSAEREIQVANNTSQIASMVAGKIKSEAQKIMREHFESGQVQKIEVLPDWWPWLPLAPFRIEVISK